MGGAFDFNDLQNQDNGFGFREEPAPPRPQQMVQAPSSQFQPQVMAPRPAPVQVDEYTGESVIRQQPPPGEASGRPVVGYRDGIPIESNQIPDALLICPFDGTKMHGGGSRPSGRTRRLAAFSCPKCGYTTTKRLPSQEEAYAEPYA
jgi:hypothetical protein